MWGFHAPRQRLRWRRGERPGIARAPDGGGRDSGIAGPRAGRHPLMVETYAPMRERLSANDYRNYQEPQPLLNGQYQTFWRGNQLPGVLMQSSLTPYVPVQAQDQAQRQMGYNASFGITMAQQTTSNWLAKVHNAWQAASQAYSGG